jgi:hypothetical protein
MQIILNLHKMETENTDPVNYFLKSEGSKLSINGLLGQEISLSFKNQINCIKCGTAIKTSFAQGYCYPCFISSPETEDCVLRPELCLAHQGIARDIPYANEHCLIDHYVYMALSGGLKVGVTRYTQKPFRWIDQGAWQAIVLAITPNRFIAGSIEVALKKHFQDKTNWRIMLSSAHHNGFDLVKEKEKALILLHPDFQKYRFEDDSITEIHYPVVEYPVKVKSVGFDKQPVIRGILTGIKGQYLMFRSGEVLNIRKHGGYLVEFSY